MAAQYIHSGYHTVSYNAKIQNISPKSQHCNGLAADIKVEGHTPANIYTYTNNRWVSTAA